MVASNCKEMGFDGPSGPFQFYAPVVIHKNQSEKTTSDRKGLFSLSKA